MLGKAIEHIIKQDKAKSVDCSYKATSTPLSLKSNVLRPKKGERVQEQYLLIVERREELKVFGCV